MDPWVGMAVCSTLDVTNTEEVQSPFHHTRPGQSSPSSILWLEPSDRSKGQDPRPGVRKQLTAYIGYYPASKPGVPIPVTQSREWRTFVQIEDANATDNYFHIPYKLEPPRPRGPDLYSRQIATYNDIKSKNSGGVVAYPKVSYPDGAVFWDGGDKSG